MQLIRISSKVATVLAAAFFAIAVASCSGPSSNGDDWAGKYKTQDTQGNAMEITLADDGKATGMRGDENLSGSWSASGDTVTIDWGENWTTKLAKEGDKYTKTAYKDGTQDGEAVSAEKVD